MGYYVIPRTAEDPLEMVVNPQGLDARTKARAAAAAVGRVAVLVVLSCVESLGAASGSLLTGRLCGACGHAWFVCAPLRSLLFIPVHTLPPQKRVWNAGDFRCKLVTMAVVKQRPSQEQDNGQPAVPAAVGAAAAPAEAAAGAAQQGAAQLLPQPGASWEGVSLSSQELAEEGPAGPGDEWQAAASDYHAASEKFMRGHSIQGQALASDDPPPGANGRRAPFGSGSIGEDGSLDE